MQPHPLAVMGSGGEISDERRHPLANRKAGNATENITEQRVLVAASFVLTGNLRFRLAFAQRPVRLFLL